MSYPSWLEKQYLNNVPHICIKVVIVVMQCNNEKMLVVIEAILSEFPIKSRNMDSVLD